MANTTQGIGLNTYDLSVDNTADFISGMSANMEKIDREVTDKVKVNNTPSTVNFIGNETGIKSINGIDVVADTSITAKKTDFVVAKKNYAKYDERTNGYIYQVVNGKIVTSVTDADCYYLPEIKLVKNTTYTVSKCRAYFTLLFKTDGTFLNRFASSDVITTLTITPTEDCYLYVTGNKYQSPVMVVDSTILPSSYKQYGYYDYSFFDINKDDLVKKQDIITYVTLTVKKDGSGNYTRIKDCVASIVDSSKSKRYIIEVYNGIYDMVEEFGGTTWISNISISNGERQGLVLPDYVDMVGIGDVTIKCEISDNDATENSSKCISAINIWRNNNLKNIKFSARNARYVCHDETGNLYHNVNRRVEDCEFIHLGCRSDLSWKSYKAYGGGTGSSGRYEFINCIMQAPYDLQAPVVSFHNNENQNKNYFNFDGVTIKGGAIGSAIGFGYYKKNTSINKVYIKNLKLEANNEIRVYKESSTTDSDNVFDVQNYTDYNVRIL